MSFMKIKRANWRTCKSKKSKIKLISQLSQSKQLNSFAGFKGFLVVRLILRKMTLMEVAVAIYFDSRLNFKVERF